MWPALTSQRAPASCRVGPGASPGGSWPLSRQCGREREPRYVPVAGAWCRATWTVGAREARAGASKPLQTLYAWTAPPTASRFAPRQTGNCKWVTPRLALCAHPGHFRPGALRVPGPLNLGRHGGLSRATAWPTSGHAGQARQLLPHQGPLRKQGEVFGLQLKALQVLLLFHALVG